MFEETRDEYKIHMYVLETILFSINMQSVPLDWSYLDLQINPEIRFLILDLYIKSCSL